MTRRTAVSLGAFRENEKQGGGGHRQIIQAIALFDSASVQRQMSLDTPGLVS